MSGGIARVRATPMLLGLCLLLCMFGSASAEIAAWDQDRATRIASKLETATGVLYEAIYDQPPPPGPGADGEAWNDLRDTVRRMRMEARHLAAELKKGKGQEHTRGAWRQLSEWSRDAAEASRHLMLEKDALDRAAAVEDLLRQLAPYYDPDWNKGSKDE